MKTRRRIGALVAAGAMALTLAACTGDSADETAPEVPYTNEQDPQDPQIDIPENPDGLPVDPLAVDPSVDGWASVVQAVYEESESAVVRAVLADGIVTTEEWVDSVEQANQCLADAGIEPFTTDQGLQARWSTEPNETGRLGGIMFEDATDEQWEHVLRCGDRYLGAIPAVYEAISRNPEALGRDALVLECLERHGLAPAGFTASDLFEITELAFGHPTTCAEAQADDAWVDVVCTADGGFNARRNPDWEPPALRLPNGTSLDSGQGALCLWDPSS